ncbi:hypothetical protein NPS46_00795 [Pseudomonas putida]|uniref:hypothetical protein n=1 Tax=Pseudomonas putida TaxID=303 RepID=UPI0023639231|nr:hypothetical protein [Pseudomonas putida]MDD2051086.1 hypothetical protein [Pseudomonas putida]
MKFKVLRVAEPGSLEKERVVLKAVTEVDIGDYLLAQTGKGKDTGVTNKIHNAYWFPDREIEAGDLVVLYTKAGKRSVKENEQNKSYFYYWGKTAPVWDASDRSVVLMEISSWESLKEST